MRLPIKPFIFTAAFVGLAAVAHGPDLQSLYETHQWFQLREALPADASPFYRGAVACAFNDVRLAENDLQSVIQSAPQAEQAFESNGMLANLYIRAGRYRKALEQLKRMAANRPDDADTKNALQLFSAFSRHPDLAVSQRNASTLRYKLKDGNLFLPASINGNPVSYIVDTGANISTMSTAEAKRLGLAIEEGSGSGTDSTGRRITTETAVAGDLAIGGFHVNNAAFLVISDDHQPFVDLPLGQRGVIGIPVLIALECLHWSVGGTFEIGFPLLDKPSDGSRICFEGMTPIIEGRVKQSRISLVLDTGATSSIFWPLFAKAFAGEVDASGKRTLQRITGVGGSEKVNDIKLPAVSLRIGGFESMLRPAQVLLRQTSSESQWFHGCVGLDFLRKAHRVTIDFKSLFLFLE